MKKTHTSHYWQKKRKKEKKTNKQTNKQTNKKKKKSKTHTRSGKNAVKLHKNKIIRKQSIRKNIV